MDDLYFNEADADQFISLLVGGISRAEERFHNSLNTVDEHGNVIDPGNLGKIPPNHLTFRQSETIL